MQPDAPPRNLLALAGGAGSGKTTLAEAFARARPETVLLHLDRLFHTQADRAPLVPNLNGTSRVIDFSDPRSIDWGRVHQVIHATPNHERLVIERTFALDEQVRRIARWTVYLDPRMTYASPARRSARSIRAPTRGSVCSATSRTAATATANTTPPQSTVPTWSSTAPGPWRN
ncbi:hypothetical protein [Streptomyces microflavus]|uniref:hypothetical protein n=1 Tax=Streptomyces microflavus TaxID=1919 RepID=UPI00340833C7